MRTLAARAALTTALCAAAQSAWAAPAAAPQAKPPTETVTAQPNRAPRADEQTPRPVLAPEIPTAHRRKIVIAPVFGFTHRPTEDSAIDYETTSTIGASLRLELLDWFGLDFAPLNFIDVRGLVLRSEHEIDSRPGALASPGATWQLPELRATTLGARVEPTWTVSSRARTWIGVGAAWTRLALEQTTSSGRVISVPERQGVLVEYSLALGASYDIIQDWLLIEFSMSAAALGQQSGSIFNTVQGVENDRIVAVGGLPHFDAVYTGLLGIGLVL